MTTELLSTTWNVSVRRVHPRYSMLAAVLTSVLIASVSSGQVLVGDPFVTGFGGWTDTFSGTPIAGGQPDWGVLLTGPNTLSESSDGRAGDGTTTGGVADGLFTPYLLVDSATVTPAQYDLSSSIGTYDNDGFGLVLGYQDNDNYFRVGLREQADSSVGFPAGVSVQKVVDGVITQLGTNSSIIPTVDGSLQNVQVNVNGSNWAVSVGGGQVLSGSDGDLSPGNYGVFSWGQREGSTGDRYWGTSVDTISVSSATVNQTTTFSDAVPINWRPLMMTNAEGVQGTGVDDFGNFRQDFRDGSISDDSNGFEYATVSAPNIDFIGPGVVVDEVGASTWTDYRMSTRLQNGDNDGIGLLVRVADDDSFYRINFATESMGTSELRAPRGMSIQKNNNGVWSEIYRDDQADPQFLFSDDVPFDVTVTAIGNAIKVDVVNDPDGTATPISYAPVVDSSSPILAGSVGFTNWGSGSQGNGVSFSSFAGSNGPLLVEASVVVEFELTVDRDDGSLSLTNNTLESVDIAGYSILSNGGALRPDDWMSISEFYDATPGNGSVDPNDTWVKVESTSLVLSEEEQPKNDGGTLSAGETVDLGLAWRKSQVEDLNMQLTLADGSIVPALVRFVNGPGDMPYSRSDLNADGALTFDDWLLFYPNTFVDMDEFDTVEAALAGDVDLDGDNDVVDYLLFKNDYDQANGAGAFNAMVSGQQVPEPAGLILALVAIFGLVVSRNRSALKGQWLVVMMLALVCCLFLRTAGAVALDFTTFSVDHYPKTRNEPLAEWQTTPLDAFVGGNASPSVFYGPDSALNKRYLGRIIPGTDDDIVGLVLGYEPGDALFSLSPSADYMVIDWKGATQTFDFQDPVDTFDNHHDFTLGGESPVGLALSRFRDLPTADEMWQHIDSPDNSLGGVTEIARGATLGSTAYPRDSSSFMIDVAYSATNITVSVDGVEQFNENGSFPDGRFGLYSFNQSQSTFLTFEEVPMDFTGLTATVDRSTGAITLENASGSPIDIDYYELSSPGNSLVSTIGSGSNQWRSIDSTEGDAEGVGWVEAGGSNSGVIGELNLAGASIGAGGTVSIGEAYNESVNAEDLTFLFRLADSGLILEGSVDYIGDAPSLEGDYNGDGVVNLADYVVWRNNLGSTTANLPNDNTPNMVDALDYQVWKGNFGAGSAAAVVSLAGKTVPEPASCVLLLTLTLTVMAACRSRQ